MKKSEGMKNLNFYLSLPYTTVLRMDDEGDVIARVDELPGCVAHGKDNIEALRELDSMKRLWIEDCLESGQRVPEPRPEESLPSGKWVQRVPRTLHAKLSRAAKEEGVSLNQLVTSILSERFGARGFQKTIERIFANYFLTQGRTRANSYWGFRFPAEAPKHYWDFGTHVDCMIEGPRLANPVPHWRAMVNLLPTSVEVKVENAKTNPEGDLAHESGFGHRR